MHPTVKPVAMIADAIRDVTRRAEIVPIPFAGSGTTRIAAEKTGRQACAIEYDPCYCGRPTYVAGRNILGGPQSLMVRTRRLRTSKLSALSRSIKAELIQRWDRWGRRDENPPKPKTGSPASLTALTRQIPNTRSVPESRLKNINGRKGGPSPYPKAGRPRKDAMALLDAKERYLRRRSRKTSKSKKATKRSF